MMTNDASFADFSLDSALLQALEKMEYKQPSPIQTAAIPIIMQNKDLIALAKTGSGKTAACAIPVCQKVDLAKPKIQALIVVPTRELALQYATETQKIGQRKGVKTFAIFGGEDASMQQSKLKHGVHVLVATPGRLIDFIYARLIDLSGVDTLIIDEADEMLSLGFQEDLEFIMQCLVHPHQTLLFSATMPEPIRRIAKQYMQKPEELSLVDKQASPENISHFFQYCLHGDRSSALSSLLSTLDPKQAIIFCHSRIEVEKVCRYLQAKFSHVDFLHAGLSQDLRTIITSKFRQGRVRFLVATDVAARGLDVSGITHVFIYHLADDPEIYIHRSGRTGRQEREGMVVTLVTARELPALEKVLAAIKRPAQWIGEPPTSLRTSRAKEVKKGSHRRKLPAKPAAKDDRRGKA